jgi:Zn-dependent M28 family amino/carboxypeptidase
MPHLKARIAGVVIATSLATTAAGATAPGSVNPIRQAELMKHIEVLSSVAFEGRGVGSPGETKTVDYLTKQFKAIGLKAGNPDGTYVQNVPMVGIYSQPSLKLDGCASKIALKAPADYVALSQHVKPLVETKNSDIVFVGYGVVAPEYGWDDYKDVDVRGKTIVMLINDPQIPDPANPEAFDDKYFKGRAMTYYGRWTYKYEIAASKGAAAAIIVHETKTATYPYLVVINSNTRENFSLRRKDKNRGDVPVRSWMHFDRAQELFSACGHDFAALKAAALKPDFRPVTIKAKANFRIKQSVRHVATQNVVAKLDGIDSVRKNEWLIYSAHWDHLGKQGPNIYPGASDNASGTAALLELAYAHSEDAKAGQPPARSVLFLATTAEESGLLGSAWYGANPLYPLAKTVANINIDGINTFGLTSDIGITGQGQSNLDEFLADAAASQGRKLIPESRPETGSFFRSDQFEFARVGVPGLFLARGIDYIGKPASFGLERRAQYTAEDYHRPSDVIKADWDLAGGVQDIGLLYLVGRRLAEGTEFPQFYPSSEFRRFQDLRLK